MLVLDDMLSTEQSLTTNDMIIIKRVIVPRISIHWEILQAYLNLGDETYNGNSKQCCTALLEDWIYSSKGEAPKTYTKLLEILNKIPELTGFTKIIEQCLENEGVFIGMYFAIFSSCAL